jgi:tRNA uridine 5-carboxymethylaminomethyl modification enzyme
MFTSRAEHRLRLRADNADGRLTAIGREVGLVDDARWEKHQRNAQAYAAGREVLQSHRLEAKTLWELLQRPGADLPALAGQLPEPARSELLAILTAHPGAAESLAVDGRYFGYMEKEQTALRQMQDLESKLIPERTDYESIKHLRFEAKEKLSAVRPRSLGQALRISGITPADVTVLAIHLAARKG